MIPAAVADSWFFWLAIIDGLAGVYILPTVIGIARQVEDLGLVICLNPIPVGRPTALILACIMPRKQIRSVLRLRQDTGAPPCAGGRGVSACGARSGAWLRGLARACRADPGHRHLDIRTSSSTLKANRLIDIWDTCYAPY